MSKRGYDHISILPGYFTKENIDLEIKRFEEFFKNNNIEIKSFENKGKRKLAFEIKGNKEGIYLVFELIATEEDITKLEANLRQNENIIKFIDVQVEEEIEEQSEEM